MYYVVWYIRLKKILDKHRETAASISIFKLLRGFPSNPNPDAILKSPVQDPT
jgi:hypothetical protein